MNYNFKVRTHSLKYFIAKVTICYVEKQKKNVICYQELHGDVNQTEIWLKAAIG